MKGHWCGSTSSSSWWPLPVTYLLTVIAREIALRTGAVAKVRDRDVHAEPIPYLGGLAMLGGLVAAYLVARELPFLSSRSGAVRVPRRRHRADRRRPDLRRSACSTTSSSSMR